MKPLSIFLISIIATECLAQDVIKTWTLGDETIKVKAYNVSNIAEAQLLVSSLQGLDGSKYIGLHSSTNAVYEIYGIEGTKSDIPVPINHNPRNIRRQGWKGMVIDQLLDGSNVKYKVLESLPSEAFLQRPDDHDMDADDMLDIIYHRGKKDDVIAECKTESGESYILNPVYKPEDEVLFDTKALYKSFKSLISSNGDLKMIVEKREIYDSVDIRSYKIFRKELNTLKITNTYSDFDFVETPYAEEFESFIIKVLEGVDADVLKAETGEGNNDLIHVINDVYQSYRHGFGYIQSTDDGWDDNGWGDFEKANKVEENHKEVDQVIASVIDPKVKSMIDKISVTYRVEYKSGRLKVIDSEKIGFWIGEENNYNNSGIRKPLFFIEIGDVYQLLDKSDSTYIFLESLVKGDVKSVLPSGVSW